MSLDLKQEHESYQPVSSRFFNKVNRYQNQRFRREVYQSRRLWRERPYKTEGTQPRRKKFANRQFLKKIPRPPALGIRGYPHSGEKLPVGSFLIKKFF